jgi:hypothetical protein
MTLSFIDWMITLADLLLSGNESKIQAARNMIDSKVFIRIRNSLQ